MEVSSDVYTLTAKLEYLCVLWELSEGQEKKKHVSSKTYLSHQWSGIPRITPV